MEDKDIFEKEPEWEQDSELRLIRKTIRRRNRKTICASVLLAAVLLVVTVFGILPWAESLFWNPDKPTTETERTWKSPCKPIRSCLPPAIKSTGLTTSALALPSTSCRSG